MNKPVLFCSPSIRRGNGLGHLLRCAWIAESLENGRLFLPEAGREGFFSWDEITGVLKNRKAVSRIIPPPSDAEGVVVLLDRRQTSLEDLKLYPHDSVFLGLDEGGGARNSCVFLMDTLPRLSSRNPANLDSPALLQAPERTRTFPREIRKILLTFGGEDPANLTSLVSGKLSEWISSTAPEGTVLTVCRGYGTALKERNHPRQTTANVEYIPPADNLKNRLADYDLVLTSFGLTAWEALRAGTAVLLVNPSSYHRRLSRRAGFISLGTNSFSTPLFLKRIQNPALLESRLRPLVPSACPSLPEILADAVFLKPVCPACGLDSSGSRPGLKVLARFPARTWYRCGRCSLVFQNPHREHHTDYGEDYFFKDYQRQYGKTYLEDFPHLRVLAAERLAILGRLLKKHQPGTRLLEIGCAYGPFLAEARERGYDPMGIDISAPAASWAAENLGLPVKNLSMEELDLPLHFGKKEADVLVLWYVIEHFENLKRVLLKIASLQKKGGILAFSTPNFSGVSGTFRRFRFLNESPGDHYHIWSPRIARRVLKLYGYAIRKVRVTGHHPERFPLAGGIRHKSPVFRFLSALSRLFRLGDTFEIYCVKTKEPGAG